MNVSALLQSMDIELSGLCNADCVFCPRDKMTREKTNMSPIVFRTLMRELSRVHPDGPRFLYFCGLGEPLLNKSLFAFSEEVSNLFPDTLMVVVSNGGLLDQQTCDAFLSGGIYALSCSMQSIDEEKYQALMRGPSYQNVMTWMKYLAQRRWETGLQVTATYVRTTQTDEEAAEYQAFWDHLGIPSQANELHSRGGFLESEGSGERRVRKCFLFNSRIFVAANGDVLACCNDLDGQSKLGTIGIDSLESILERKAARIAAGRLFPMCSRCTDVGPCEG